MNRIIEILTSAVNLDGYGASDGFLGYFEINEKYHSGMAEAAVDFLLNFYGDHYGHLFIASSLHANSDEVGYSGDPEGDRQDLMLVNSLVSRGVLRSISYIREFGRDYDSESRSSAIDKMWASLSLTRAVEWSKTDLRDIVVAKLLVHGMRGHFFLVFDDLAIAFYPSDDIGFGVVALTESADVASVQRFLTHANALPGFHAVTV